MEQQHEGRQHNDELKHTSAKPLGTYGLASREVDLWVLQRASEAVTCEPKEKKRVGELLRPKSRLSDKGSSPYLVRERRAPPCQAPTWYVSVGPLPVKPLPGTLSLIHI